MLSILNETEWSSPVKSDIDRTCDANGCSSGFCSLENVKGYILEPWANKKRKTRYREVAELLISDNEKDLEYFAYDRLKRISLIGVAKAHQTENKMFCKLKFTFLRISVEL